jgi:hypothetical protein
VVAGSGVILLCVLFAFYTFAAAGFELALGSGAGRPGEYVTVSLRAATTMPLGGAVRLEADIGYDPSRLVFIGGQNGVRGSSLQAPHSVAVTTRTNGAISIAIRDRARWTDPFRGLPDGELARLTFKVQPTATAAAVPLVLGRLAVTSRTGVPIASVARRDGRISIASSLPQPPDSVPPTVPRRVTARAIASDTVEVFWFDSRDDVGVSYRIYRATVTGWADAIPSSWTTPALAGTAKQSGLERVGFVDTGLTPLTDYVYWVSAVDPAGNESSWKTGEPDYTRFHAAPRTLAAGNTIRTGVMHPQRVAPGEEIVITQTMACRPACRIGHHDVHWNTRVDDLPPARALPPFVEDNFGEHSVPDNTMAPTRTSVARIPAPRTPGNFYFMEDAHVFGPGFPLSGAGGNSPHQEGMLFRVVVSAPGTGTPLTIDPVTAPNGRVGAAYRLALTAGGEGNGRYEWGVNEGRLPPGLVTDQATGAVTGTPTAAGTWSFSVMVEDSDGITAFRSYTLTIEPRG